MAQNNYVLDVNVYVSFIIGKKLFKLASFSEAGVIIYTSPNLLEELLDVLNRPKIKKHLAPPISKYIQAIENFTLLIDDISKPTIHSPDKDDDYLFELAHQTDSVFVTADKELLYWKNSPVAVISLTTFLKLF